ncbi:glutamine cyclotransferase (macronuclear) [Tetrahymena thermophila SB210]|uniref:Glutamine cyclotransferase n=1 Tax=Tetrahymena thermophila (strain SB210) TaxID=312017 RepID=Q22CH4_TETTS|nr:glutamine cyclotransferase [Tetrahymena thermophila SB210]EAR83018.1 glutamine cyclotransferase [Tetrahymena thermophila SB210]|eukprot:XP_001030681.1 glutamine cyclotransferase [Tetrahymena thermophila SB210]
MTKDNKKAKQQPQFKKSNEKKKGKLIWVFLVGIIIAFVGYIVMKKKSQHNIIQEQKITNVKYGEKVVNNYKILERYNRQPNQYTQCFMFYNSTHILETSGLYEISSAHFLKFDRDQNSISEPIGAFNFSQQFNNRIFAEGCTLYNNQIYVLTYKEDHMLVFDHELKIVNKKVNYPSFIKEGWGLTHYNNSLIVTDGSNKIYFFDENLVLKNSLQIKGCSNSNFCTYFNELEIYKGYLLANQYYSNIIYVINMITGQVEKEYDMQFLAKEVVQATKDPQYFNKGFVFNGIAFDELTDTLLVTGKFWPFIYQIQLLDFPNK